MSPQDADTASLDPSEFVGMEGGTKKTTSSVKLLGKSWRLRENEVVLMMQTESGVHRRFTFSTAEGASSRGVEQFTEFLFGLHPEVDIDDEA